MRSLWNTGQSLLIVLGLIAVVLALFQHFPTPKQELSECAENLVLIRSYLRAYKVEHCGIAPANLDALVPRFCRSVPKCPTEPIHPYQYKRYSDSSAGQLFVVMCPGKHPGIPSGFPAINYTLEDPVLSPDKLVPVYQDETPLDFAPTVQPRAR